MSPFKFPIWLSLFAIVAALQDFSQLRAEPIPALPILPERSFTATPLQQRDGLTGVADVRLRRLLDNAQRLKGRLMLPTWSRDGKQLVCGSFNPYSPDLYALSFSPKSQLKIRKLAEGKYVEGRKPAFTIGTARAFSPDGKVFATGSSGAGQDPTEDSIQLWSTDTWKNIGILKGHPHTVNSIVFSPDGKRIISGNNQGGVIIHDVAKRSIVSAWCRGQFVEQSAPANVAFWNHEGKVIPIAVIRYFPDSFSLNPSRPIAGCVFAPEEKASELELWDVSSNRKLRDLPLPRPYPPSNQNLSFSPDGRLLALFTIDHEEAAPSGNPYYVTILDWQNERGAEARIDAGLYATYGAFNSISFLPDGKSILLSNIVQDRLATIDVAQFSLNR